MSVRAARPAVSSAPVAAAKVAPRWAAVEVAAVWAAEVVAAAWVEVAARCSLPRPAAPVPVLAAAAAAAAAGAAAGTVAAAVTVAPSSAANTEAFPEGGCGEATPAFVLRLPVPLAREL